MDVEILIQKSEGICTKCFREEEVACLMVTSGTSFTTTDPLCTLCFQRSTEGTLRLELEDQPQVDARRVPDKRRRKAVSKQEKRVADAVGGRTQIASGAMPWAKGDVRKKGKYRIECKSTEHQSYSLKREILDKIASECSFGEIPILQVDFIDKHTLKTEDSYVVLPGYVLKDLNETSDD